jgi:hypothetical protein
MEVSKHRYQLEYDYFQDPNTHVCHLEPLDPLTYFMGNFRFGHSYALLTAEELENYNGPWLTYDLTSPPYPALQPWDFYLNWNLSYPHGQDYTNPEPNECGDEGTWYFGADINKDCRVDFEDFTYIVQAWLQCTDPEDANCL